jgi:hypothetical protein
MNQEKLIKLKARELNKHAKSTDDSFCGIIKSAINPKSPKSTPVMKFSECCKSEVTEFISTEGLLFKCFRCGKVCDIAEPVNEKLTTANQEVQEVNESMEDRFTNITGFGLGALTEYISEEQLFQFIDGELALERKKIRGEIKKECTDHISVLEQYQDLRITQSKIQAYKQMIAFIDNLK